VTIFGYAIWFYFRLLFSFFLYFSFFTSCGSSFSLSSESAGGFSVCWHLAAPSSAGLFRAAIIESGNCQSPNFFFERNDAYSFGSYYANLVGCNATNLDEGGMIDCLRNLTVAQILGAGIGARERMGRDAAWMETRARPEGRLSGDQFIPGLYPVMPWGSTIDKSVKGLMDIPLNVFLSGKHNKVPVMLGTNHNEGTTMLFTYFILLFIAFSSFFFVSSFLLFVDFLNCCSCLGNIFIPALPLIIPGAWFPLNEYRTILSLQHFFNDSTAQQVFNLYEFSAETYEGVMANVIRDLVFTCEARRVANALVKYNANTYLYAFTFVAPNWIDQWILGDYHSSELEYVYSNPWPPLVHIFDSEDIMMADAMGTYWTQFAASGNSPNTPISSGFSANSKLMRRLRDNFQWPVYNDSVRAYMNLTIPLQIGFNLDYNCDFWDSVHNWRL
jgi:carboxylesterase type B